LLLLLAILVVPLVYFGWFAIHGVYPYFPRPYFFFPLGIIVFFVLIFVGFRVLFWGWGWGAWRRGYYGGYGYYRGSSLEILDERYARGEITKEQYDQMKRDIQQRPT